MRDLFDQISENTVSVHARRAKANKGSKLARRALEEAMGEDSAHVDPDFGGRANKTWDELVGEDDPSTDSFY